jgi:aerobic-type carbon monoxide dehydrogenase small subunit (CoxS/CutS family)
MSACGGDGKTVTETVTKTAGGSGSTVTITAPGKTVTTTVSGDGDADVTAIGSYRTINFTLNNEEYKIQTMPEWTLQYVLHDKMGMLSIKDMCTGYGACGACTAIVDGKPVLTCMLLAIECDGKVIETAENLAITKHPLADAYVKYDCMQCGYCTPGFVITAKALLDRNPNPTEDEAAEALAGNLCRCGTYPQHILAVMEAASKLGGS